jgi:hypothetical protein
MSKPGHDGQPPYKSARPINGVPFPGHRGTRIPDPAAQRITGPAGGNGNGNGGRRVSPGCAFIVVFVLTAAAIVAYTLLTR